MVGRRSKLILLAVLVAAAVFSSSATAQQQSTITISIVDGSLIAENVFDDDGGIEFVDLVVGTGENTTQYRYENVGQGAIFDVPFTPNSVIYYNFMDSDGQIVNVGYLIFVQNPKPPKPPDDETKQPKVVLSYEINVKRAEDNRNYNLEFVVDLNKEITVRNAEVKWGLGEGASRNKTSSLSYDSSDRKWKTTIGPFVGKVVINSGIYVTEQSGKNSALSIGNRGFYLLVSDVAACNETGGSVVINTEGDNPEIGTVLELKETGSIEKINSVENGSIETGSIEKLNSVESSKDKTLFLQNRALVDFSYLAILNINGTVTATDVYDDDGTIQRVDIFVINGTSSTQYTDTNVGQGMTFPISIPSGATAFYNYMDTDGRVANVSSNNIIGDGTVLPPKPDKKPPIFKKLTTSATPNANYTSYTVDFEVLTNDGNYNVTSVVMKYKEDVGNNWQSISLQRSGGKWIGSTPSFNNERLLDFSLTMTDAENFTETKWPYSFWFDIVPPSQVRCIEICGNKVDDDEDELVDEGCVLLPDVLFTDTQEIPDFIVIGSPIKIPFTIKNAGVADTENFEVALLLNDGLVDKIPIGQMKVGDYNDIEFRVEDSNIYEGNNRMKIQIDYGNVIPELNELNNTFEKDVVIGMNGLILTLNSNKTDLLGDDREIKVMDRFGSAVGGATVAISYPSGASEEKASSASGLVSLKLTEAGNYLVNAEKEGYASYSGAFNVRAIIVSGIGDVVNIGETIDFIVETEDKKPISDAKIEIEYPTGERNEISLNSLGQGQLRPTISGGHKIIVTRNGIKVFESGFIATGLIESLFIGSNSLGELLFGSILRSPLVFLLLLVICLIAAWLAFNRSRMLFATKAKSTREKQVELAVRIGIALLFFIIPFQVNRFFGLQASIGFVIIEIASVLIADYYNKQIRMKRSIGVR